MQGSRKRDGQLDGFLVFEGSEFQFGH
jgi:hypothetical protein